jgi:septal ring factor EnvC (AmiA/AmiB activator)
MEANTLYTFIGIVTGLCAVILAAIKWLIADWYKKSEEIENIRKRRISRIENEAEEVRKAVNSLKDNINEHSRKLGHNEAMLVQFKVEIRQAMETLDGYRKNLDANVRKEVRSQVLQLSEQLRMVREKKNGS